MDLSIIGMMDLQKERKRTLSRKKEETMPSAASKVLFFERGCGLSKNNQKETRARVSHED